MYSLLCLLSVSSRGVGALLISVIIRYHGKAMRNMNSETFSSGRTKQSGRCARGRPAEEVTG